MQEEETLYYSDLRTDQLLEKPIQFEKTIQENLENLNRFERKSGVIASNRSCFSFCMCPGGQVAIVLC